MDTKKNFASGGRGFLEVQPNVRTSFSNKIFFKFQLVSCHCSHTGDTQSQFASLTSSAIDTSIALELASLIKQVVNKTLKNSNSLVKKELFLHARAKMRFHMKSGSEDNDIVAATATAEHIRKFVFSGSPAERLEIKIPEVSFRK